MNLSINKKEVIINYILLKIQLGYFEINKKILSEGQIAIKFGTTIQTVHKALTDLTSRKILFSKPKIGFFVNPNNYVSPNDFLGIKPNINYKVIMEKINWICNGKNIKKNVEHAFIFKTFLNNKIVKIHFIILKNKIMKEFNEKVFNKTFEINKLIVKPSLDSFNVRQCLALINEIVYSRTDILQIIKTSDNQFYEDNFKNIDKLIFISSNTNNRKNQIIEKAYTYIAPEYFHLEMMLKI